MAGRGACPGSGPAIGTLSARSVLDTPEPVLTTISFSDLRIVLLLMTAVSGLSSTNLAGLFWTKLGHQHQIFTGDFDEKFGPVPGVVWRGVLDDDTGPSCDVV